MDLDTIRRMIDGELNRLAVSTDYSEVVGLVENLGFNIGIYLRFCLSRFDVRKETE